MSFLESTKATNFKSELDKAAETLNKTRTQLAEIKEAYNAARTLHAHALREYESLLHLRKEFLEKDRERLLGKIDRLTKEVMSAKSEGPGHEMGQ